MSLIIYFLRHGETTASRTGGYCGTLDPELIPEGYQMAQDFADAMPLRLAGADRMMELMLGETNMPLPIPNKVKGRMISE